MTIKFKYLINAIKCFNLYFLKKMDGIFILQIDYYLDEDKSWALSLKELKRAIAEAKKVCKPRALVVINPGNPTGKLL